MGDLSGFETMTLAAPAQVQFGPWNPGIESPVPRHLRHRATLFRPDNVYTSYDAAEEIAALTGLNLREVVAFRPDRLALHALLVHLTADFSIPDGRRIEDLGINFREIAAMILARYVGPEMGRIAATYERLRGELARQIRAELAAAMGHAAPTTATAAPTTATAAPTTATAVQPREARSRVLDLFTRSRRNHPPPQVAAPAARDLLQALEGAVRTCADPQRLAALRALNKVAASMLAHHGRLWGEPELIVSVATGIACNDWAARAIGALIEPLLAAAARQEGYRLLPRQEHPVVMNTKGPSASGKSTLRPLQRSLAQTIGFAWSDFALISPDIWRKQLLDYATLGDDYKYAGSFTGDEVRIIDEKLDRYMAEKARRGEMPHLLIDRFRFDSFAPDSHEAGSNLLTRFGQIVYLFFVITPPASLVERAWHRGLEVGRYKPVDDLLAHSIEAYTGMPDLIFTWVQRGDKRVHFELLDNTVALGTAPRTVAFGWNDTFNVLDIKGLLDIERFRRVDVDARSPQAIYRDDAQLAAEDNTGFIRRAVERFREINFADRVSGRIYLRIRAGRVAGVDAAVLGEAARDPDVRAGLLAAAPAALDGSCLPLDDEARLGATDRRHTVGTWGSA
jgi:hypothetical protein